MKLSTQLLKFVAIALSAIASVPNYALATLDNNLPSSSLPPNSQIGQNPPPAPDNGTPQTGGGAGTRPGDESNCPVEQDAVVALLPKEATLQNQSATLWFHLPYSSEEIEKIEFVLSDKDDNYVVPPTDSAWDGNPGFISFETPQLAAGQSYTWVISVYCDRYDSEDRISLSGVIQPEATRDESANNLWYEEFDRLAGLRRDDPDNEAVLAEWQRLLESLELSDLADKPVTSCCEL